MQPLYEFLRNTDLNAAGFFKPTTISSAGSAVPFQKPATHRNQYGGNFGGPILHDKMFFFLDYEGLRAITSPLYVLTLPTQNELNGILVVPVENPSYRHPLPGRYGHPLKPPSIRCPLKLLPHSKTLPICRSAGPPARVKTAPITLC